MQADHARLLSYRNVVFDFDVLVVDGAVIPSDSPVTDITPLLYALPSSCNFAILWSVLGWLDAKAANNPCAPPPLPKLSST